MVLENHIKVAMSRFDLIT